MNTNLNLENVEYIAERHQELHAVGKLFIDAITAVLKKHEKAFRNIQTNLTGVSFTLFGLKFEISYTIYSNFMEKYCGFLRFYHIIPSDVESARYERLIIRKHIDNIGIDEIEFCGKKDWYDVKWISNVKPLNIPVIANHLINEIVILVANSKVDTTLNPRFYISAQSHHPPSQDQPHQ